MNTFGSPTTLLFELRRMNRLGALAAIADDLADKYRRSTPRLQRFDTTLEWAVYKHWLKVAERLRFSGRRWLVLHGAKT